MGNRSLNCFSLIIAVIDVVLVDAFMFALAGPPHFKLKSVRDNKAILILAENIMDLIFDFGFRKFDCGCIINNNVLINTVVIKAVNIFRK